MIVGLDISTSCIGCTFLFDRSKVFIEICTYLKLKQSDSIEDKFASFVYDIGSNISAVDHVFIEDYSQAFSPGKSTATTITKLAHFSGMIRGYLISIGAPPTYLNVLSARKAVGLPNRKGEHESVKERCYHILKERFADDVPMEYTRPRKKDKKPELRPQCMDATDSLVIALAGHEEIYGKQK